MIFPDAVKGEDQIKRFVDEVGIPITINMGLGIRSRPTTPLIHVKRLEAIGVARVMALADPNGANPDLPAVVKMLEENLAQVPARVLSPAGRALMPGRRAELQRFLNALRAESDGLRSL